MMIVYSFQNRLINKLNYTNEKNEKMMNKKKQGKMIKELKI